MLLRDRGIIGKHTIVAFLVLRTLLFFQSSLQHVDVSTSLVSCALLHGVMIPAHRMLIGRSAQRCAKFLYIPYDDQNSSGTRFSRSISLANFILPFLAVKTFSNWGASN
jgi:hypothetical protein